MKIRALYQNVPVIRTGFLKVSDIHTVYFEECGNPKGQPIVFLHGGPGGGIQPSYRGFFDPNKYRIVLFDQRGCGLSTPVSELRENTTWDLVADIERLRMHLEITDWHVFGGSWGSTLALTYAQTHPTKVTALILRGIFLLRKQEIQWFYQHGTSEMFPDFYKEYIACIPVIERHDLVTAFHKRLVSENLDDRRTAAKAWALWEGSTSKLLVDESLRTHFNDDAFADVFARIECHYFVNKGFFKTDNHLLENMDIIRKHKIPGVIVQGRYDVVCPPTSAWALHGAWPESELILTPDSGHSAMENGNRTALLNATDRFSKLG